MRQTALYALCTAIAYASTIAPAEAKPKPKFYEGLSNKKDCLSDKVKDSVCIDDLWSFIDNNDGHKVVIPSYDTKTKQLEPTFKKYGKVDKRITFREYSGPFLNHNFPKLPYCPGMKGDPNYSPLTSPFLRGPVIKDICLYDIDRERNEDYKMSEFNKFDVNKDGFIDKKDDYNKDNRITSEDAKIYRKLFKGTKKSKKKISKRNTRKKRKK